MQLDVSFLPAYGAAFMLMFARIGTMIMLLPGLGEMSVPTRVRLTVALVLTFVLFPLHRAGYTLDLRASYLWQQRYGDFSVVLEATNATNRENECCALLQTTGDGGFGHSARDCGRRGASAYAVGGVLLKPRRHADRGTPGQSHARGQAARNGSLSPGHEKEGQGDVYRRHQRQEDRLTRGRAEPFLARKGYRPHYGSSYDETNGH